jgi:hypothetical protein
MCICNVEVADTTRVKPYCQSEGKTVNEPVTLESLDSQISFCLYVLNRAGYTESERAWYIDEMSRLTSERFQLAKKKARNVRADGERAMAGA